MEKQNERVSESLQRFISDGTPARICERYAQLREAAQGADFGIFSNNVVVIDTETTGLSFHHDELTQIAAARVEQGQIVDWFITFVNPGKPIPEEISHLTNIYQSDVDGAPSPNEALEQLADFVGDAICVAHNVEFDRTFTTKHPGGYSLLENTWVDSLDLARIALPRMKSHRLLDLVRAFELPLSTHRADADVEATCAVLPVLLAAVQAMPLALLRRIAQFATPQEWSTQVVFQYFADKAEENALVSAVEAERDQKTADTFSLRAMRRKNLATLNCPAKQDAEMLAQDPQRGIVPPSIEEVAAAFTEEGLIGSLYNQFEQREEQVEMAKAVCRAFARSENLMVEAGTGVGKSMAYLLPAALMAKKNGITVGVATKTNTLLDQLIYHELPALDKALGGLTYAPLKGFNHYPCMRKVEAIAQSGNYKRTLGDKEYSCVAALSALLSFIEQTDYDDMDALKIDYRLLPRWSITCSSQECLRRKCPFFGATCMVHGSRRFAEMADIVVTNHSLLFCDAAADGSLLPPIRHWIVDEAHGAEAEARSAFSAKLSSEELQSIANRVSADDPGKNVFVRAARKLASDIPDSQDTLFFGLTNKASSAGKEFAETVRDFIPLVKDLLYYDTVRNKNYEVLDLWLNDEIRAGSRYQALAGAAQIMCGASEKLIKASQDLVVYLDDFDSAAALQREIAITVMSLKEIIDTCDILFKDDSGQYAFSATLSHKKDRYVDTLEALPIDMGNTLEEALYERTHSVVYASATLAVGDSFSAFERALGLNQSENSQASSLRLNSSFDFDRNMTIYVPSDLPDPTERNYLTALVPLLTQAHIALGGSMLTLFTNKREMENCFDQVYDQLKPYDLRLVCQKKGVSVKGLRDEFVADKTLSLFALKSFWEGFDAPGSTLRGVIIPKLPFTKPTDPLSCERGARDADAWRHYVLPAAVIEMKQAAGRLLRTANDSGILILADHRLITKSYGKTFLASMPSKNIRIMTCAEIVADIARNRE